MLAYKCCTRPDYRECYVWFWPFKGKYCRNCEKVIGDTGRILDWMWQFFIWPFWDGRVKVEFLEGDKEIAEYKGE